MRPSTSRNQANGSTFTSSQGRNKAAQHGRGPASVVAPEESPVIPSDREAPQRPLGPIVIDGQIAIAAVTRKRV